MKMIIVGDIHGHTAWKNIVNTQEFDKIIFIGDYWDSFYILFKEQAENFLDICAYKRANMEKVVLLFGNHDFHYLPVAKDLGEKYSGYQKYGSFSITTLLLDNLSLFQMAYEEGKLLFTHAGVTETWLKSVNYDGSPMANFLNELFKYKPQSFIFNGNDAFGDDITQSPIWVRPGSLMKDSDLGFIQIVGHTGQTRLYLEQYGGKYYFIDTLGTSGEYLVIEDGTFSAKKIETNDNKKEDT